MNNLTEQTNDDHHREFIIKEISRIKNIPNIVKNKAIELFFMKNLSTFRTNLVKRKIYVCIYYAYALLNKPVDYLCLAKHLDIYNHHKAFLSNIYNIDVNIISLCEYYINIIGLSKDVNILNVNNLFNQHIFDSFNLINIKNHVMVKRISLGLICYDLYKNNKYEHYESIISKKLNLSIYCVRKYLNDMIKIMRVWARSILRCKINKNNPANICALIILLNDNYFKIK